MSPIYFWGKRRLFFALAAATGLWLPATADAQRERTVPKAIYYASFRPFHEGEYEDALDGFRAAARSGVRSTEGRWVDSICYHTMIGECYYQMGDLRQALDQYNNALKLSLAHNNWMLRVEWPDRVEPSSSTVRSRINWGASQRSTALGNVPDTMLSAQGRLNNDRAIQQGGVVAPPQLVPLRVKEVVRCCALAQYRRWQIMGPTSVHDPLTANLLAMWSRRPAPANHWSQAWVSINQGMAHAAAGQLPQAIAQLRGGLVLGDRYDHELTGLGLLALGQLALEQDQLEPAATFFLEATYAAAAFGQYSVVGDAFRGGNVAYMVSGGTGVYPPLVPASNWADRRAGRQLHASLLILAAENFALQGDAARASSLLGEARRVIGRREMGAGAVGARLGFETARVNFVQGNLAAGSSALAGVLRYQRSASRRLFQIGLADALYVSGAISDRAADLLFAEVLREPTASDWTTDTLETLSVTATPHLAPMEHWFEVAIKRKEHEKAMEIADRLRRHRFYSTLPLGGRVLALRWILEAPEELLPQEAILQRQDLLAEFPGYAQAARRVEALKAEIAALPRFPEDPAAQRSQEKLFSELASLSTRQELTIHDIALRREPSEFTFPPKLSVEQLQRQMPEKQLILAFFSTSRYVYAFALSKENFAHWPLESPRTITSELAAMLEAMGHRDRNQPLPTEALTDGAWRQHAAKIMEQLFPNVKDPWWKDYEEVVIVPDNMLWYLPFEALPASDEDGSSFLVSQTRIRYAPTVSLTQPDARPRRRNPTTGIAVGDLFPGKPIRTPDEVMDEMRRVAPGAVRLPDRSPIKGNLLAPFIDRAVVLEDIEESASSVYDWSPLQIDAGEPGGRLSDWFALPWGAPDEVVLPTFHTLAERGLSRGASGDEIFLAACGMMSTGTRTLLISRWRTGGASTYDLVREMLQELPFTAASNAWQRSVQLLWSMELDPTMEPRLRSTPADEPVRGEHPFFWAGYLLIDTGSTPPPAEAKPAGEALDDKSDDE